jgi:hypothetical protein
MIKAHGEPVKRYLYRMAVFFLFSFWACEPGYDNLLTSPADFPTSIFAFLNTAADSQYVVLHNSTPPAGPYHEFLEREYQLLRQAKVKLSDGDGDFVFHDRYELVSPFHEDFEHDFVFVSAHRVRPGETYRLHVEIPEKGVYTASTTAPGDFQILAPSPLDTLDVFNPLAVEWTAAQGAAGYRVVLQWTLLDSFRFKSGRSDTIDKVKERMSWYVEPSPQMAMVMEHKLDRYYRFPDAFSKALAKDTPLLVFVEALDAPAWLAREINQRGSYEFEKEIRTMPGVYSNIEGALGLMSAVTTKMIPVVLPP